MTNSHPPRHHASTEKGRLAFVITAVSSACRAIVSLNARLAKAVGDNALETTVQLEPIPELVKP